MFLKMNNYKKNYLLNLLLLLFITITNCNVIKREIINEFIDNSNLTIINNDNEDVEIDATTSKTINDVTINDSPLIITTTTETNHFDINKYMTNYNNDTEIKNSLTKPSDNNNNNNNINESIYETQYEENFNRLLLTTPVTPHFDDEHKKYLQIINNEMKNFIKLNDNDNDDDSTNINDNNNNTNNKYIINDLNTIIENKTDEKLSSIYYNNAELEHNNYDSKKQEIIETVTIEPSIINQTTEKRGKYLHTDIINDNNDNDNNFNKNFMNLSIPNTAEVWALASMKGVDQYKEKIGQFYNITETKDLNKNDTVLTKVLADWAAVMKNDEFNNDTYLSVTDATSEKVTDISSNIDSTENLIKINNTIGDHHIDTASSESKVINNFLITSPPPLEKNNIDDQIGDTSSSVVTVEKLPFTDYKNEETLGNNTKHNIVEIDDDGSGLNKSITKHDDTFFYENALPKEENKTIAGNIDVTIQTLDNTSDINIKNSNHESIEESELINNDGDLEMNQNVPTTDRGNKIEAIIFTTEAGPIDTGIKRNQDDLIITTTTDVPIIIETSTMEQLEELFKTVRINFEKTTAEPVNEDLPATTMVINLETTTNPERQDETSTISQLNVDETTVPGEIDLISTTTDDNIINTKENPITTESSNITNIEEKTVLSEINNNLTMTTESNLINYTETTNGLDDEEETTIMVESTTNENSRGATIIPEIITTTTVLVSVDDSELHDIHGLNERINQQTTTDINDYNFNNNDNIDNDPSITTTEKYINNNYKINNNETEIIKIQSTTTMETINSIDYTTETTNIDKLNVESSTYVEQTTNKDDMTTVSVDVSNRQHETIEEQPVEEMEFNDDLVVTKSTTTMDSGLPITDDLKNQTGGLDSNIIIAISVSVIGIVAIILLVAVLFIMRKRQKQLTYGQRCRPVGLDAYSLDNVSVYNSVRRKGNNLRLSKRSYGNSAFEDPGLRGNNLSITSLAIFVTNKNDIYDEFKEIPQIVARADEVPVGCEGKNRYANVVPLPETRVYLKQINNDEKTEYINANFVRGPKDTDNYYIACQAPMENTVADFWRMIWEHNSKVIIMATDLSESGIEKCAAYLPPSSVLDCYRLYGDFQVTLKNREVKDKYAVSSVQLKNMLTSTWREITHFWYQWPDTGVPSDEASVIGMLLEARSYLKMTIPDQSDDNTEESNKATDDQQTNGSMDKHKSLQRQQGPLTVHCSPGTGRTGTIIACDIALRTLEMPSRSVDVPQIVYSIRRGRASAVRTREQYEFIYKTSHMYATKLTEPVVEN